MSIVVVGSIAFDTIKTPHGKRERALGGAANYFAMAAHFFSQVHIIGIIGEDFPPSHLELLGTKNISINGIERALGKSFHWEGEYTDDLHDARTINARRIRSSFIV